ncbi:MAG: tRNA dihydrouridine synthase DusB [Gemmatimonadaceae bacterium]
MRFPYPVDHEVPLILAPMAGVSESPFRRMCRRHGADVVVTEFLSAEGIRRENEATLAKLRFGEDERTIGVQIFGADPDAMRDAAALVTDVFQPEFIDINFGCPVKKVVRRNGGSGCLKDLSLVRDVIHGVISGTHLPVTVKIRSGWNEELRDPVRIALHCQDAGARALALHPRSRTQMYTGQAQWDEIAAVKAALEIPVIGNGDIKGPHDAYRMRQQTGCDGVMIARGSFGQPWIFNQARALLNGEPMPATPSVDERFAAALEHARMVQEYEVDPEGAAIEFRKHLGWYVKGLPNSADLRKRLHAVNSFGEVEGIFGDYLVHWEMHQEIARGGRSERREGDQGGEFDASSPDAVESAAA